MERKEKIHDNQLYHIYNRGNNKQAIFMCHEDYTFFLKRLKEYSKRYSVNTLIYCLMPNHYHLILTQNTGGNLPQMMDTLATSVAKRFNLKYKHVGHLFQGPYKYKSIESDQDFVEVARYIHLNPVIAGLAENPHDWQYSNYAEIEGYLLQRKNIEEGNLLQLLNKVFKGNPIDYISYVEKSRTKGFLQQYIDEAEGNL